MKAIIVKLWEEPAFFWTTLVVAAEAVNAAVLTLPNWLHVTLGIVIAVGGASAIRGMVSPIYVPEAHDPEDLLEFPEDEEGVPQGPVRPADTTG